MTKLQYNARGVWLTILILALTPVAIGRILWKTIRTSMRQNA